MSLVDHATEVSYASPAFDIDKIVGVWEGSFNRATDVITRVGDTGTIYLYPIAHGFSRPVFVDLLWKLTGAWTDGGISDSAFDASIAFADSTYIYIVSSVFAPAVGTMEYKVIASWISNYDGNNPLVASFLSPNKKINFDSRLNYQKIYRQGVLSFGSSTTQTITHDLGKRSNFRIFFESFDGEVWPQHAGGASNPFLFDSAEVECRSRMKLNTLDVTLDAVSGTKRVWYRIYLDTI